MLFCMLMSYVNARSVQVQTRELFFEKGEWVTIWVFSVISQASTHSFSLSKRGGGGLSALFCLWWLYVFSLLGRKRSEKCEYIYGNKFVFVQLPFSVWSFYSIGIKFILILGTEAKLICDFHLYQCFSKRFILRAFLICS